MFRTIIWFVSLQVVIRGQFPDFPFPSILPFSIPTHFNLGDGIKIPDRSGVFDENFEWNIIDYAFPSPQIRQSLIQSGQFIPENNLPLGVDRWKDKLFITTPRWKPGTPVTLSTIDVNSDTKSPLLEPYPNYEAHSPERNPDCSKLASVFRTYADTCDRLWVIDSGVSQILDNYTQLCPPKIVIYELNRGIQMFSYVIPANQLRPGALHANIIVDVPLNQCENAFAYVTDVWRFGIIVFDFNNGNSWRTTSNLYYPNPIASDFDFRELKFQLMSGAFGLAVSPIANQIDGSRTLFFHPMSSYDEFMVSTSVLKNASNWVNPSAPQTQNWFQRIGTRGNRGQSITVGIDRNGVMFYGLIQKSGIGCWDIRKPYTVSNLGIVESDEEKINFLSDIKVDNEPSQSIWALSNFLPVYLYSTLDYNQINFRILSSPVERAMMGTVCDPSVSVSFFKDPFEQCFVQ